MECSLVLTAQGTLTPDQLARRAQIGEQRRARSRATLMAAAYELFAMHGSEAPTIDDVLRRAALAKGTFYNHFKTRDDLFRAVADEIADSIDAVILQSFENIDDPAMRICIAFRVFVRYAIADRARGWIWLRTMPISGPLSLDTRSSILSEFTAAIETGRFTIRSVELATDLGLGLQLMTIRRMLTEEQEESYIDAAAKLLLVSLGVEEEEAAIMSRFEIPTGDVPAASSNLGSPLSGKSEHR